MFPLFEMSMFASFVVCFIELFSSFALRIRNCPNSFLQTMHKKRILQKIIHKICDFEELDHKDMEYIQKLEKQDLLQIIEKQNLQSSLFNYLLDD